MPLNIQEKVDGLVFPIRVQPRSSKNRIVGLFGDALKICTTSPPVDNAANKSCCEFLAKRLRVKKSSVKVVSGQTSRDKLVMVQCGKDHDKRKSIRETILAWGQK